MTWPRCSASARKLQQKLFCSAGVLVSLFLASCASAPKTAGREIKVSVADQKMALYENGNPVKVYGISTSKYGVGDGPSTNKTPVGKLRVAKKIGLGAAPGMVFKSRRPTGEVLRPNAEGRDPVVTRIMWLQGTESKTSNAYGRFIYIHGTPEEKNIGRPASYGCVRMRSMDVIDLFNQVSEGTPVNIENGHLPAAARHRPEYVYVPPVKVTAPLQQFMPVAPGAVPGDTKMVASTVTVKKVRKS